MQKDVSITAISRKEFGKGHSRRDRLRGYVPAVCYSEGLPPIHLLVDKRDMSKILKSEKGINSLVEMTIIDGEKKSVKTVMMKDYQLDPLQKHYIHADFLCVSAQKDVEITVPVRLKGRAAGESEGGVLNQLIHFLKAKCKPSSVPREIVVDVSGLKCGEVLYTDSIEPPEGVKILSRRRLAVVYVSSPPKVEEKKPTVAVAEEEIEKK
jgi:large subunit ribosomal protein L25